MTPHTCSFAVTTSLLLGIAHRAVDDSGLQVVALLGIYKVYEDPRIEGLY